MSAHPLQSIAMSIAPVDIAVFSKDRRPMLIVDVKNGSVYGTAEAAVGVRSSLIEHGFLPDIPFFMLATTIQIFLWCGDAEPEAYPNYSATTNPIFDSYGMERGSRERSGYDSALDIVFFWWLSDLMRGAWPLSADSEVGRMLLDSGLHTRIQDGTADFDVML
jgi:hypothetical protein